LKQRIEYWAGLSDYDLETADAMLTSGRYLYVGYMCHQVIEKILKAFFCKNSDDPPPYSHNLSYLANRSGLNKIIPSDFSNLINILEPLNIEARYPTYKEQLLKSLTYERCREIIEQTKELQIWVKKRL